MKTVKRFMSILISLSMILSIVSFPQITSFAEGTIDTNYDTKTYPNGDYSEKRADLTFEYLGQLSADYDTSENSLISIADDYNNNIVNDDDYKEYIDFIDTGELDWQEGNLIFIAVKLSKMTRQTGMFNSTAANNSGAGLAKAIFSLAFDTNYFELPKNTDNNSKVMSSNIVTPLLPYHKVNRTTTIPLYNLFEIEDLQTAAEYEAKGSNSMKYTIRPLSLTETNKEKLAVQNLTITANEAYNSAKLLFMDGMTFMDSTGTLTDATNTTNDPYTLGIFVLKQKANAPKPGEKVIEGYFNESASSMTVGTTQGDYVVYTYGGKHEYTFPEGSVDKDYAESKNLNNRFNITSLVNLFPATYTVTYDANTGSYVDGTPQEKVEEDHCLEFKDETTEKDVSTLVKKTGYILKGWNSKADGTGVDVDPTTAINKATIDEIDVDNSTLTLFAQWEEGYNVNFHADGGSWTDSEGTTQTKTITRSMNEDVYKDGKSTILDLVETLPTWTGHTFEGWYYKNDKGDTFTTQVADSDLDGALNKTVDIYAKWTGDSTIPDADKATLNFNNNTGNTEADPKQVQYNTSPAAGVVENMNNVIGGLPVEPTKDNYEFLGWYKTPSGDGTKLEATTNLNEYLMVDGERIDTVYARWGRVSDVGNEPDTPPTPDEDAVTLHFVEESNLYSDANGGTYKYTTINDKYIKFNDNVFSMPLVGDLTAPTIDGNQMAFGGWYTKPNGEGKLIEDGVKLDGSITDDKDAALTEKATLNLYAKWVDKVSLTYDANGCTNITVPDPVNDINPGTKKTVGKATIADDTKYEFVKWNTKADGSGTDYNPDDEITVNGNTTLYAIWNYINPDDKIDVIFNVNDTTQYPGAIVLNDGATAKEYKLSRPHGYTFGDDMPTAVRSYYKLLGWNEKANATSGVAKYTTPTDTSITKVDVYAIWESTPDQAEPSPAPQPSNPPAGEDSKVTITFDANADGASVTINPTGPLTIDLGDSLGGRMVDNPERDGYAFIEWNTQADGKGVTVTKASTFTTDDDDKTSDPTNVRVEATNGTATLYAIWQEQVTVEFNVQGKSSTQPPTIKVTPGTKLTELPEVTPNNPNYQFVEWNDQGAGGGKSYTADNISDDDHKITKDTTLYAVWEYIGDDAVTIIFHGNGTGGYPAILSPNDSKLTPPGDTDIYTLKVAPDSTLTFAEMPLATRTSYKFNYWGKNPNDPEDPGYSVGTDTITTTAADAKTTIHRYAIWIADDKDNPNDNLTVSFDVNEADATGNLTPPSLAPITVKNGDVVGESLPSLTSDSDKLLGWMDVTDDETISFDPAKAFDKLTTQILRNTKLKAYWSQQITITFATTHGDLVDVAAGSVSADVMSIYSGETVATRTTSDTDTRQTLPVLADADGYLFKGWFYEEEDGSITEFKDTDTVNESITVNAKWEAPLTVTFTNKDFEYDSTGQTPVTDRNYQIKLSGGANDDLTSLFTTEPVFKDIEYAAEGAGSYSATKPVNKGTYSVRMSLTKDTLDADPYTVYVVNNADTFNITAKRIDLVVSNNEQPIKTPDDIEKIVLNCATPAPSPAPNTEDILPVTDAEPTATPTDFNITFTPVLDGDQPDPDPDHKIVNKMPDQPGKYVIEITPTDTSNFDIGTVTDSDGDGGKDGEGNPIPIYLEIRYAEWVATFKDNASKPTPDGDLKYTVNANKAIAETDAVTKITDKDDTDITDSVTDKTVLPTPQNPYPNKDYIGWTSDESAANDAPNQTKAAFEAGGTYADKLFDVNEQRDQDITLYAVYVKSSDATLADIIFKKTEDESDTIAYTQNDWTVPTPEIAFDPDQTEYWFVVDNGLEDIFGALVPEQSESTIAITINGETITDTRPTTVLTDGTGFETIVKTMEDDPENPGEQIEVTKAKLEPTVYTPDPDDPTTGTNSSNTVVVKVTAPDGTEKEYTFHILEYAEARIELNYGNSPVGMIMRVDETVWDDSVKTLAIKKFDESDILEKKYEEGYDPRYAGLTAEQLEKVTKYNLIYTAIAWQSYNSFRSEDAEHIDQYVNYDLDPYALFAYRGTQVKDPGITVYDKFNRIVAADKLTITREFKAKQLTTNGALPNYATGATPVAGASGLPVYDTAINTQYDAADKVTQIDVPLVDGYDDIYQLDAKKIRSDVYEFKYEVSYKDGSEDVELDKTRKAIILGKLGDLYIAGTDGVSAEDASNFSKNVNSIQNGQSLVAYRCADFKRGSSVGISAEDSQHLSKNVSTTQNLAREAQYYSDVFEVRIPANNN